MKRFFDSATAPGDVAPTTRSFDRFLYMHVGEHAKIREFSIPGQTSSIARATGRLWPVAAVEGWK